MGHSVALLTPSYAKDVDRFALLAASIDRYLTGYTRHYVVVSDDDMSLFARFNGPQRVVLPASKFLPRWLMRVPGLWWHHNRKVWWSFRTGPIHGWHVQQLLKIAAVSTMPEQRYCIIDSDNAFFRPYDIGAYAGGERIPLYVDPQSIPADKPMHGNWTRNCDILLGLPPTAFPADDYIGNEIVWDQTVVRAMTARIETVTKMKWMAALGKTRAFSEYLIYGNFVHNSPALAAQHERVTEGLNIAYWDEPSLSEAAIRGMILAAPQTKVAISIASLSHTPVEIIRKAIDLP